MMLALKAYALVSLVASVFVLIGGCNLAKARERRELASRARPS